MIAEALLVVVITGHLGTAPEAVSITPFSSAHSCEKAVAKLEKEFKYLDVPSDRRHHVKIGCVRL